MTSRQPVPSSAIASNALTKCSRPSSSVAWQACRWRSRPVAPEVPGGSIPLVIGGTSKASVRRTIGTEPAGPQVACRPDRVAPFAERIRAAWRDAGKEGEPRIVALTYFSLGDDVESASYEYLRRYYGHLGDTERIAANALRSGERDQGCCSCVCRRRRRRPPPRPGRSQKSRRSTAWPTSCSRVSW